MTQFPKTNTHKVSQQTRGERCHAGRPERRSKRCFVNISSPHLIVCWNTLVLPPRALVTLGINMTCEVPFAKTKSSLCIFTLRHIFWLRGGAFQFTLYCIRTLPRPFFFLFVCFLEKGRESNSSRTLELSLTMSVSALCFVFTSVFIMATSYLL